MNDTPTLSRDYRIVRVLGQGGMGVVYEAEHGPLGRRVALKVLSEESNTDPTALARLRREALSMGALQHPHIVQVTAFSEGPPPFLVMELLSGQSLRERLVQRGPMRPVDACLVAVQLLSALGAAHRAGIVHRDVKPANVFVVQTPVTDVFVKLLDFGVAKLLTPQGPALTSLDAIIGSAPYMAPEQIRGEAIDGKTDLFALGITLYELLCGRRPFVAAPNENVMVAILRGGPIAPLVGVPRELEAVVLRALSRSPSARYLTAEDMSAALMPFVPQDDLTMLATTAMSSRSPPTASTSTSTSISPSPRAPTFTGTVDATRHHVEARSPILSAPPAPVLRAPSFQAFPRTGMPVPLPRRSISTFLGGLAIGVALVLGGGCTACKVLLAIGDASSDSLPLAPSAAGTAAAPANPLVGSCMIRIMGSSKSCTEHSGGSAASLPELCAKFSSTDALSATWSNGPCDRTGAVFGCQAKTRDYTQWVFPPLTRREKAQRCTNDETLVRP